MLTIMTALALAASAGSGASTEDRTIHSCPAGWEVGGWEVGGWEVGDTCVDKNGQTWTWDGQTWYPDPYRTDGQTW